MYDVHSWGIGHLLVLLAAVLFLAAAASVVWHDIPAVPLIGAGLFCIALAMLT